MIRRFLFADWPGSGRTERRPSTIAWVYTKCCYDVDDDVPAPVFCALYCMTSMSHPCDPQCMSVPPRALLYCVVCIGRSLVCVPGIVAVAMACAEKGLRLVDCDVRRGGGNKRGRLSRRGNVN